MSFAAVDVIQRKRDRGELSDEQIGGRATRWCTSTTTDRHADGRGGRG
jgi:hypothetical protein